MNNRKKHYSILLILVVSIGVNLLAFSGIFAYLTSQDKAINTFTIGQNVSSIQETFTPPSELQQGDSCTKIVSVKNEGSVSCYVRVLAEVEDPLIAEGIEIDWNTKDWTEKQSDGYYYYKKAIEAGETTEPLFTTLTAKKDLSEFRMIVYEESTQSRDYDNAVDAFASYTTTSK